MAHALRKLLRHSDHTVEKRDMNGGLEGFGEKASPSDTARRLLARACHRDAAKVSPAEKTIPMNPTTNNNHNSSNNINNNNNVKKAGALSRASSFFKSKKNHMMNENSLQHAKLVRTRRLMKEYQEMCRQQRESDSPIFTVELADDNLFEWNVKLHKVDPDSELYRDMQELSTPFVLLNLTFPDNFPFAPPFMRVITPRIEKGFVMDGGAICMELLTPRGWASAYTVEAVIMQFAASLVKGQARIARKAKGTKEFSRKSAEASFRSLVKTHEKYGWVTPPLSDG
uniref:E2 ubiquitin-conjugating enzyme n=1 Tax=Strigamia maritima TaxID=126957 RepID=T1J542_STRMM